MHVTILALGSRGDIQPYANLGAGLLAAGHQARLVTFQAFAPLAASYGLDFHPIQGDPQAMVASAGANTLSLVRAFGALGAGYACDLSDSRLGETDLILNQLPVGLYGYDLAEKYSLPLVLAAVIPLAPTRAFPMMGFPRLPLPGYNRVTYSLAQRLAWGMFRAVINRWRMETLSLAALPLKGYFDQLGTHRVPILNGFSRHVVPRPADWTSHIHITGSWYPPTRAWQPPTDLVRFLEAGPPPVFIGFGSMPVHDPPRITRILLEALRRTGQRAILHTGWAGIGRGELPGTVFKVGEVPYEWLFPRVGMVVHHGGSGTTAFGLRAGIPSWVVSFVFDQYFWGQRIAALGVGPAPCRVKALTVEKCVQAFRQGLEDNAMRQKAAQLGHEIRAENGIEVAVKLLETAAGKVHVHRSGPVLPGMAVHP